MRVIPCTLLGRLLTACSGGDDDALVPPILPETGEFRGTEGGWIEFIEGFEPHSETSSSYIERRSAHFGLIFGKLNWGNCRVGPTGLFLCGEDEHVEENGENTTFYWGTAEGEILDEQGVFMEIEYKLWCEGDCDRVVHGIGQWCMIRVHGYLDDDFSCGVPRDDW